MFTGKRMLLYRGSLKSCNYRCSYCPFSKHKGSDRECERDKEQWLRFVESVSEKNSRLASGEAKEKEMPGNLGALGKAGAGIRGMKTGAVMVVPYGEALIHPWYWEGLGRLAALEDMDGVGAQTNLSFSVEEALSLYRQAGGKAETLRLWATFHPEMTKAEVFADKCRELLDRGVTICAGAVGVPGNEKELRHLRDLLPEKTYLWINKMDGLKRPYREEELRFFSSIDPYFGRELMPVKADPARCMDSLFVEGDGRLRACNLGLVMEDNWYDAAGKEAGEPPPWARVCSRKLCSCYLAYGGRRDAMNHVLFGPYPLFRIPRRPKAAFLDIDGTLTDKDGQITPWTRLNLELLSGQGTRLFFATTLPLKDAGRRCRRLWPLFEGGIFAGGAHILWREDGEMREKLCPISRRDLTPLKTACKSAGARLLSYEALGSLYKLTLVRPGSNPWQKEEITDMTRICKTLWGEAIRLIAEGRCLQVVAAEASKEEGVRFLCHKLGISPWEAAAAGDSPEDEGMIRMFEEEKTICNL